MDIGTGYYCCSDLSGAGLEIFKDQVMMKPTVEKLNNEVTVTDAEYNIELKGMNVPNANLKDFKGKVVFLIS